MRERRVTIDFETRSPIDIKFGSQRYSEDPRTEVMCLAFLLPDETEPHLWVPPYENIGLYEWDEEQGDGGPMIDLWNEISSGTLIEAHNASFERAHWENIMVPRFGWPEIRPEQWRCSASVAAANSLPRSLDGVSKALELPEKDAKGHKLMLKLSKPRGVLKADLEYAAGLLFGDSSRWKEIEKPKTVFQLLETISHITPERGYRVQGVEGIAHLNPWHEKPEELERLFAYCKNDVMVEHAVSETLGEGLSEQELEIWQLDQTMNFRGMHLDMELVDAALALTDSAVADGNERLFELTGGQVSTIGQRDKFLAWINAEGRRGGEHSAGHLTPPMENLQKATIKEALDHPELWEDDAYEALRLRASLSKTSTSKYKMMVGAVCKDSRARGTLYYHGTDTGRWAGRGVQPQNFPRGTIKAKMDEICNDVLTQDKASLDFLYGDAMEVLSSALRGAICAAPGSELVSADYAAIEARGIFWLAGDHDALKIFSSGGDIYKEMAVKIYNVPISEVTKDMRHVGKTAILGLGYGMGSMRFREQVGWQDRPANSIAQAQRIVNIYRLSYPKIPAFWKALNDTAMLTVETGRTTTMSEGRITMSTDSDFLNITLPSGRNMKYYKPKVERLWSERFENWQKKLTFMAVNTVSKKYGRWETFGGRLAENVTSGMCRDIMAEAMLRAEDGGVYKPILTVHDEILCEVKHPKGSVEDFEELMTLSPLWADGFPIKAEGWKGLRYRK
jgi:DNA polymerase bacteriophage-type